MFKVYRAIHQLLEFVRNASREKRYLLIGSHFKRQWVIPFDHLGSTYVVKGLLYRNKNGATCQGRTDDILITSEALYQLS